ncbi:cytochrome P450 71A1 [Selaginella moellendorffii]|nr:cytochrome P450 71A1 [Selaginella moellendorffii]|eukprot:XP_002974099.2 cytochrome P450 71A1 [Selaginella moellendorffii]
MPPTSRSSSITWPSFSLVPMCNFILERSKGSGSWKTLSFSDAARQHFFSLQRPGFWAWWTHNLPDGSSNLTGPRRAGDDGSGHRWAPPSWLCLVEAAGIYWRFFSAPLERPEPASRILELPPAQMGVYVLSTIAIAIAIFLWKLSVRPKLRLPPSPLGIPLIGHLAHLAGKDAHITLQRLSNKLGPILFLRLGWTRAIVVSSAEMAREVLHTQDVAFASRPYMVAGEHLGYNFRIVGIAPYGEHWRNMRKLCTLQLFTSKRMASFASVRAAEVSLLLSAVARESSDNGVVDVRKLVSIFIFNIITQILMSKRFLGTGDCKESREFKEIVVGIVDVTLQFHIADFVPKRLRWIDWTVPQLKRLAAKMDKFFQRIVDEHKAARLQANAVEDFTHIMLTNYADDEELVKAMVQEMLNGGTHTTSATIEWAVTETIRHPRILEKAQQELEAVVGLHRRVEESDLEKLPYLQCIVKETLRRHPPAPLLVPHMSTQACKVGGYDVPKGTTLFVNAYAIGMDPSYWENPLEFLPERFAGTAVDVRGQDFELLPFGSGRRSCPAMTMGLKTAQFAVSSLIHAFDWSAEIPRAVKDLTIDEGFCSLLWPETPLLKAVATPKLSKDAY